MRIVGRMLIVAGSAVGLVGLMVIQFVLVAEIELLLMSVPVLVAIEVGRSQAKAELAHLTPSTPISG